MLYQLLTCNTLSRWIYLDDYSAQFNPSVADFSWHLEGEGVLEEVQRNVRLQICSFNFKFYLKNYMAGPCQKGQISGLWMNSGWCNLNCLGARHAGGQEPAWTEERLKVALLSCCWWNSISSLFSSSSCQCTLVKKKMLDSQMPKECSLSALGAG